MPRLSASPVLQLIRRAVGAGGNRNTPDEELLRRFAASGDEAAYAALVHRHGPMVFDVCRSLLRNDADAEDAFQATFVVLARKASSIRKAASLASWLHGVAHRTALKARASFASQRRHESQAGRPETDAADDRSWSEVRHLVHQELARLARRYQDPLVLCYLEGRSQAEAADCLGLSRGTLRRRLEAGRRVLRARLLRHGLGSAGLLLAAAWPASAAPPVALTAAAVEAAGAHVIAGTAAVTSVRAATLATGVIRSMLLAQIRTVTTAVILAAGLVLGGTALLHKSASTVAPLANAPGRGADSVAEQRRAAAGPAVDRLVDRIRNTTVERRAGDDTLGLFMIDAAGKEVLRVAGQVDAERGYCGSPNWTADGSRILFDATPGKQWDRSLIQALGPGPEGLELRTLGPGNCPTLSPDGRRLAFTLNPGAVAGAPPGIYLGDGDGKDARPVGQFGISRWEPDGRRLLTITFASPCELTLVDPETSLARGVPLTIPGYRFFSVPSWVEPGRLAAVVQSTKGTEIALVDVTDPRAPKVKESLWRRQGSLAVDPAYPLYDPVRRVGFFVGRQKEGQTLYRFEHGQAPRPFEAGRFDQKIASLALSPDGRYLLFASDRP